ncbi:hypothetical protein N9R79_11070 [Vibrio sp.]|nr:hypothetical protein [Vibrio sp.]
MKLNPMYADMLYLFSKAELSGSTITQLLHVHSSGGSRKKQLKKDVGKFHKSSTLKTVKDGVSNTLDVGSKIYTASTFDYKGYSKSEAINSMSSDVSDEAGIYDGIVNKVKQAITSHAKSGSDYDVGQRFIETIFNAIPQAIQTILYELSLIGSDLVKAAKHIYIAIDKGISYSKTQVLKSVTKTKASADIIHTIRNQLAKTALKSSAIALAHGGVIAINLASAGIGATVTGVIKAVVAVVNFFKTIYDNWVQESKYRAFKKECALLYSKKESMTDELFELRMRIHMQELPILASYVVSMPCYSSPYNFLALTSAVPPSPTWKQHASKRFRKLVSKFTKNPMDDDYIHHQKSILNAYQCLQNEAHSYIKESPIQLKSTDPMLMQVLNVATGKKNYIPGTDEKAFKKAVKKSSSSKLSKTKKYGGKTVEYGGKAEKYFRKGYNLLFSE